MTRLVLFDLGDTLESGDVLRPGALETLRRIADLRPAVLLGLLSDFDMTDDPARVPAIRGQYLDILDTLGIRSFFEPTDRRVTLSTEVGAFKPAPAMFRAAVARAEPALTFADTLFVTENREHVAAARALGLRAVAVPRPGSQDGDVADLTGLVPIVEEFVAGAPGARAARPALTAADRFPVAADRLHLVTQNGRLFQQEQPDVPVLADRGRLLVVDLDPARARALDGGACWTVRPLPAGLDVWGAPAPGPAAARAGGPAARLVDPAAQLVDPAAQLVDTVDPVAYRDTLTELADRPTRLSTGPEFAAAAAAAGQRLAALGYRVSEQQVRVGAGTSANVIADRAGRGAEPRRVVLVTAHLDSVNLRGPQRPAPGADDNASGSAGVLEIARVLAAHDTADDLRLILFGGEEQGLLGSTRYVAGLDPGERARIRAVVNMDMIGVRNGPEPAVLLEGAAVSAELVDVLARAAATHTGLAVVRSFSPANSDHVPFIEAGIPAVLTIEGSDSSNGNVHSERDTLDTLDWSLAVEIVRMNVAAVAELLGDVRDEDVPGEPDEPLADPATGGAPA